MLHSILLEKEKLLHISNKRSLKSRQKDAKIENCNQANTFNLRSSHLSNKNPRWLFFLFVRKSKVNLKLPRVISQTNSYIIGTNSLMNNRKGWLLNELV